MKLPVEVTSIQKIVPTWRMTRREEIGNGEP